MKKLLFLFVFILSSFTIQAEENELEFLWNRTHETGAVLDIKFAPDPDYFYVVAQENSIDLRETATGDLIKRYDMPVISYANFQYTPDSTKMIIANAIKGALNLVNLEDMSLIKYLAFTEDRPGWVIKMVVDPIRPYVYIIDHDAEYGQNEILWYQVSAFNYETMELVKHFTDWGHTPYSVLDVSHDGRYLAFMNAGKSYLQVWDLNTMERYRNFKLYDDYIQENYCEARGLKFSKEMSDKLYFSGMYPNTNGTMHGAQIFRVFNNKIERQYFPDHVAGNFALFDNEERALVFTTSTAKILNFETQIIEHKFYNTKEKPFTKVEYSKEKDLFIGKGSNYFTLAKYNRDPGYVKQDSKFTISPNPASDFINIETESLNNIIETYNMLGILVLKAVANEQIDVSMLPRGIYFVKVNGNNSIKVVLY